MSAQVCWNNRCRPFVLLSIFARFLCETTCIPLSRKPQVHVYQHYRSTFLLFFFSCPTGREFCTKISHIHDVHARLPWVRHVAINPDLSFHDKLSLPFVYIYTTTTIITFFYLHLHLQLSTLLRSFFESRSLSFVRHARRVVRHVRTFLNYLKTDWFRRMSLPIAKVEYI